MARILVIEDHPVNLELMRYLLTAFGHEVIGVGDAEAGLARARTESPDLVVCDIELPGMNGVEFVRTVRADPVSEADNRSGLRSKAKRQLRPG